MTGTFGTDSVTILRQLRAARERQGHSQKKIAGLLRVTERTFHAWEAADTEPRLSDLCRWARLLGFRLSLTAGGDA